jgi:hypothetical protein
MPDWLYSAVLSLLDIVTGDMLLQSLAGRVPESSDACEGRGHSMDEHRLTQYTSPCEACACEEYRPNLDWLGEQIRG